MRTPIRRRVFAALTDQRPRIVFLTLAVTGIRRIEITSVRWRDGHGQRALDDA
jgi:integrase